MESVPMIPIAEFIRYNNWANQQVLLACEKLSESQLAATMPGTYGSIRDTLEHIIRAEAGYVGILTGDLPIPSFQWEMRPSVAEIREYAAQIANALWEAAQSVHPSDMVVQEWQGEKLQYQALVIYIQLINHGIEHRTNITTILGQELQTPPAVDGWGYFWDNLDRFQIK